MHWKRILTNTRRITYAHTTLSGRAKIVQTDDGTPISHAALILIRMGHFLRRFSVRLLASEEQLIDEEELQHRKELSNAIFT